MVPRIAITAGEPAGIGPDLVILQSKVAQRAELVIFADPDLIKNRANQLGIDIVLREFDPVLPPVASVPGEITIRPVTINTTTEPQKLNPANSKYVLETISTAVETCMRKQTDALVTGPIHKGVINDAGIPSFTGHTEYLSKLTGGAHPVMMLATENLRVALITTHLPLKEVSQNITRERISNVIHILNNELTTHFAIKTPKLLVCGLNPHAGENGHLGIEEIETIIPTLETLRQSGIHVTGPLPADTAFTSKYLADTDVVVAMYHDQGLPVLKYAGFGKAVNITLGLPLIRTSVDHGTALDLAGTGKADIGSLVVASNMAMRMIAAKKQKK